MLKSPFLCRIQKKLAGVRVFFNILHTDKSTPAQNAKGNLAHPMIHPKGASHQAQKVNQFLIEIDASVVPEGTLGGAKTTPFDKWVLHRRS